MNALEKLLPQNIEAEQAVLGSLIIDPNAITQILEFLLPDDFYRDSHKTLYRTMLTLYQQGTPADYVTLTDDLERTNRLEDAGGARYVTKLIDNVPTSANVEHYARIVERAAILRRLAEAAGTIAAIAYDNELSTEEACGQAEQIVYQVAQRSIPARAQDHRVGLTAYMEKLHNIVALRHDGGAVTGVPTGIRTLDVFTGGLQRSDLCVLCARPAIGKTSFAINIARHAMSQGKSVLFFSLEMSREQVWQRILADETGIDQTRLRSGWFSHDDWDTIEAKYGVLMDSPGLLTVDDTSGLNPLQMRSITRRKQSELSEGVDFVIIDYLQLVKPTEKQERRDLDIGSVTKSLKGMAKELSIPVLALAQLSRSADGVEPQLSHLAESGAIEMDSDLVMGMWVTPDQVELKKQNASSYNTELIIMKHRNGPVGGVTLTFTPGVTRFEEYGAVKNEI